MKALLYKEFKLAMHPICYVFIFLFPFMILIPSFPLGVGFIYLLSAYPILFLGANKGQQSNDLLYSTLLPVRKKDIVMARLLTVVFMQVAYMALMAAIWPLASLIQGVIPSDMAHAPRNVGLGVSAFVSLLGFGIIGFAVADLIFFPIYYRNGRSIVMSTLLTILGFVVYLAVFTVVLPETIGAYKTFFTETPYVQFIFLGGAILLSFALHFFAYKASAKRLEKVDF